MNRVSRHTLDWPNAECETQAESFSTVRLFGFLSLYLYLYLFRFGFRFGFRFLFVLLSATRLTVGKVVRLY